MITICFERRNFLQEIALISHQLTTRMTSHFSVNAQHCPNKIDIKFVTIIKFSCTKTLKTFNIKSILQPKLFTVIALATPETFHNYIEVSEKFSECHRFNCRKKFSFLQYRPPTPEIKYLELYDLNATRLW